jgi:hypothetical protein
MKVQFWVKKIGIKFVMLSMKVVHLWAQKTMVILETSWGTHHWDPMGTWLVGNTKNPPKN